MKKSVILKRKLNSSNMNIVWKFNFPKIPSFNCLLAAGFSATGAEGSDAAVDNVRYYGEIKAVYINYVFVYHFPLENFKLKNYYRVLLLL